MTPVLEMPTPEKSTQGAKRLWTYDEVRALDDDVLRELHDGEIFEMPSPNRNHQDIAGTLFFFLKLWAQGHGGRPFIAPLDLYVSATRYYIPDLIFYTAPRLQALLETGDSQKFTIAPDIVAEVLSPGTYRVDRTTKMRAYAAFGVAHYWILDPQHRLLEAFTLENGRYILEGAFTDEETFAPAAFPGLELDLKQIFELA